MHRANVNNTQGKSWPNLMSMSLRNELRQPLDNKTLFADSYNWEDWYSYVRQGADAINKANPDVLIFLSGLNSDTDLGPVVEGASLSPGSATFNKDDFGGYGDKLVLELHNYDNIYGAGGDCSKVQNRLFDEGFKALTDSAANQFPIVLTEFGFGQDQATSQDTYASCLMDYLTGQNAGWMIWVLSGSYYIREGTQDYDEPWGLLTHDWSDWRAPDFVEKNLASTANTTIETLSKVPASDDDESSGVRTLDSHGKGLSAWVWSTSVFVVGLYLFHRS